MDSPIPDALLADPLVSERVAAEFLKLSPTTLSTWRSVGRYDLAWIRVGSRIRYRTSDLLEFAEKRRQSAQRPAA